MTSKSTTASIINIASASPTDWRAASETALLDGVLDNNALAWREFVRRYQGVIDKRLKYIVNNCWTTHRSSDTLEDIRAEVYLALADDDMRRLRAFDPKRGNLTAWLSLIAQRIALNHLDKLSRRPPFDPIEEMEEREDHDAQRGARWVDAERDACEGLSDDAAEAGLLR